MLAVWTVAVWARPVLSNYSRLRLSNPGDSESFAFYLSWNIHALTRLENPFFAPVLYAPDGLDLGNAISVPSVSLLVAPVTAAFGGTAGYNTALLLAFALAGIAVYLLARELFGSVVGATIAGALVIVSPYMTGHALSHLNLVWVAGLPFLAYLVVRRVRGRLGRAWLVILVALTIAFTLGASTELFVTQSVFAVIGLTLAALFAPSEVRRKIVRTVPLLAAGVALGCLLGIPVIVAAFGAGIPETAANAPSLYSTELTNIVAPTPQILLGDSFFATLRATWLGNDAENTAYVPFTLLALTVAVLAGRRTKLVTGILVFAAVALVLSFGPYLTIAGNHTVPMPWWVTGSIPGLDHALPARFTAFSFMALALIAAYAWAQRPVPRWFTGGAVGLTLVLLLPNLPAMAFPTNASVPEFVTDGSLSETLDPGENVLVLPAGQWGPGMRWQDELDFAFDMPTGNGGGANIPEALLDPTGSALFFRVLDYDWETHLLPYLEGVDVDTVIVDGQSPEWKAVMDQVLPGQGVEEGGVWVYALP